MVVGSVAMQIDRAARQLINDALAGRIVLDDGDGWRACWTFFSQRLDDGSRAGGPLMRRRDADGRWHYRRMTPEERLGWSPAASTKN